MVTFSEENLDHKVQVNVLWDVGRFVFTQTSMHFMLFSLFLL